MWPEIWSSTGTVQTFSPNKASDFTENFSVFVNNSDFFASNFSKYTNIQKIYKRNSLHLKIHILSPVALLIAQRIPVEYLQKILMTKRPQVAPTLSAQI